MGEIINPSRRALLKLGASLPVAAALPTIAAPAVIDPIWTETVVTAPVATAPTWGWYVGWGQEGRYSLGPFSTRDEALAAGRSDGDTSFDILEAIPGKPDLRLTGDDLLEVLDERNEDHWNPEGDATIFPYDISKEARRELGRVVSDAIAAWVDRHNVAVRGYMFADTRNEEFVPEPLPSPILGAGT